MKIRPATRADVPAIMEVRLSVRENTISSGRLAELGISEETLADMLETSHTGHCVEEGGRVVGFAMADRVQASIFALFVRPEFEGRDLGSELLEAAVNDLWAAGHARATLTTEPETRAFRFYTRRNWRHVGFAPNGEAELELLRS